MMSMHEQRNRARDRAKGMQTYTLTDGRTYIVRSRSQEGFYTVQTTDGSIDFCDCLGWRYRRLCKHSEAVLKRLQRERKAA